MVSHESTSEVPWETSRNLGENVERKDHETEHSRSMKIKSFVDCDRKVESLVIRDITKGKGIGVGVLRKGGHSTLLVT